MERTTEYNKPQTPRSVAVVNPTSDPTHAKYNATSRCHKASEITNGLKSWFAINRRNDLVEKLREAQALFDSLALEATAIFNASKAKEAGAPSAPVQTGAPSAPVQSPDAQAPGRQRTQFLRKNGPAKEYSKGKGGNPTDKSHTSRGKSPRVYTPEQTALYHQRKAAREAKANQAAGETSTVSKVDWADSTESEQSDKGDESPK